MFEKTRTVMKNRGKIEKAAKLRRKNDIVNLRNKSSFKAKLFAELQHVDAILQDPDIDSVIVTVPDRLIALFSEALYDEDLASFSVMQVEGQSNQFIIKRRFITF